ncbi:MAG: hypothetical protein GAK28_02933 [Luteibacter sp.]|uniref:hypothetical protein n=1 Tax=Luteibacter sp. TaxID=1886636 RepID=UPI0013825DB7|nr:hypothetical protein [Luteibacter sp.]KAF1006025.1 MAG: hypothetical protein GAK28_02933 [Luteibacter sp.]
MIAIWFSCGAASAWAAKLTIERYGYTHDIRLINNPVAEEDPDNQRFARDVGDWLGVKVEQATNPKYPDNSAVSVWDHEKYMSGVAGAPCTKLLKKHARQAWELEHKPDFHVLGFTAEEKDRHDRFVLTERPNVIPALIDARASKADCFAEIRKAGIELPAIYKRGYPNANCIGCSKATSPTYWNHVREKDPEVFVDRAEQSRRLGCRLVRVRGERKFLDELKTTDQGLPLKNMDFECGIFCEERAA